MCGRHTTLIPLLAVMLLGANIPEFEDYPSPSDWHGPEAQLRLITPSERMFRTRLNEAIKQPPNFADHYRVAYWGCGSMCGAGAVIDLRTGDVYPPPLGGKGKGWERWISCTALFQGTGDKFRVSSRLFVTRCGSNFDKSGKNWPDVFYFLWEGNGFRELLHVRSKIEQ